MTSIKRQQSAFYESSEDDEYWQVNEEPLVNVLSFGWTEGRYNAFIAFSCLYIALFHQMVDWDIKGMIMGKCNLVHVH